MSLIASPNKGTSVGTSLHVSSIFEVSKFRKPYFLGALCCATVFCFLFLYNKTLLLDYKFGSEYFSGGYYFFEETERQK